VPPITASISVTVVGDARRHFPGARLLVEAGRERQQVVVDAPAQVGVKRAPIQ
jgi:hypothetical protein